MPKHERLYRLIKAMSPVEKAYFKKHTFTSKKDSSNNYIKLFDYINRMESWDEAAVINRFKKEKFVKNFAVAKKYLLDSILKTLRSYEPELSTKSQIRFLIKDAATYERKEMIEASTECLLRAKELAYETEEHNLLVEIVRRQRFLVAAHSRKRTLEEMQNLIAEQIDILNILTNESEIEKLSHILQEISRTKSGMASKEEKEQAKNIIEQPDLKDVNHAKSLHAKILFYRAHTCYNNIHNNLELSLKYSRMVLEVWESNEAVKQQRIKRYIISILNFLNNSMHVESWNEYLSGLNKLKAVKVDSVSMNAYMFGRIKIFEYNYGPLSGDEQRMMQLAAEIEEGLSTYHGLFQAQVLSVLYNILTMIYHRFGFLEKALLWNNTFLNFHKLDFQKYFVRIAVVINLMLRYEMEDFDILQNLIRSYYRELKNRPEVLSVENAMYDLFRDAIKNYGNKNLEAVYLKCYEQLETCYDDPVQQEFFSHIDFRLWVKSKVLKQSFNKIMLENDAEKSNESA